METTEKKEYFETKYYSTDGIIRFKEGDYSIEDNYLYPNGKWELSSFPVGKDVFPTLEEALNDAEKRRQKKIASLKKQLKKLEEMEFKVVDYNPIPEEPKRKDIFSRPIGQ